jgi:hypothetical protein
VVTGTVVAAAMGMAEMGMAEMRRRYRRWAGPVLGAVVAVVAVVGVGGRAGPALSAGSIPAGLPVTVTVGGGSPGGRLVNESLLGVDGPGPAGATADMAALHLAWVRTDVSFDDPNNYDCRTFTWVGTDLEAKLLQIWAEGARPLLIVDYTPACLVPAQAGGFPPSPYDTYEPPDVGTQPDGTSDQSLWQGAVHDMASSVLAFAQAHGEASAATAPVFEIWNEPDGSFWFGGLPGYLHLYADSAPQIEAAAWSTLGAPVEVGGPGLLFADPTWIQPFLAFVSADKLPLDFLSWHYYGDYPEVGPLFQPPGPLPAVPPGSPVPYWYNPALRAQSYGLQVEQVRAELAAYPDLHPALMIDEWNVDAGYDPRQDGPYDAAFAAAVLDSVQQAGLDGMAFFDVANSHPDPTGNWGMLYYDPSAAPAYSPKPVYWAFDFWHQLGGTPGAPGVQLPVSLWPDQSASDPVGRIGAVASSVTPGAAGATVRVLLYDFVPYDPTGVDGTSDPTPYDHTVTVVVRGLGARRYAVCAQTVDGAHPAPASCPDPAPTLAASDTVTLTMHGDGVTLLTLSPEGSGA